MWARRLEARKRALVRAKFRSYNLFSTTKILGMGIPPTVWGAIRPLAAVLGENDRPGDCASAPTQPTPAPLQSYISVGVRRLPRLSEAARQ